MNDERLLRLSSSLVYSLVSSLSSLGIKGTHTNFVSAPILVLFSSLEHSLLRTHACALHLARIGWRQETMAQLPHKTRAFLAISPCDSIRRSDRQAQNPVNYLLKVQQSRCSFMLSQATVLFPGPANSPNARCFSGVSLAPLASLVR